jgi:hypothetical protein
LHAQLTGQDKRQRRLSAAKCCYPGDYYSPLKLYMMYVPYACDTTPILEGYSFIGATIAKLVSRFVKSIANALRPAMVKERFSKLNWNS